MNDLRYALTLLRRRPGFAAATILTLAVTLGVTLAVASLIYGLLLRPLPVASSGRLLIVHATDSQLGRTRDPVSYPQFREWEGSTPALEQMAAFTERRLDVTGDGVPAQRLRAAAVSEAFFETLGVSPVAGRVFTARDAGGSPCVISHALWQSRFGGRADALGRTLRAGDLSFAIVGVMPPAFQRWRGTADVWVPIGALPELAGLIDRRGYRFYTVVGRLRVGATRAEAETQLAAGVRRQNEAWKDRYGARAVALRDDLMPREPRRILLVLSAMVALVWLIGCANVGGLLLARATDRLPEMAVRVAIGASRARLVRQLLIESLVIAGAGAVLGLVLARWTINLLVAAGPAVIARTDLIRIDAAAVVAALALTAVTTVGVGLAPAVFVWRRRTPSVLGHATPGRWPSRVHDALVGLEIVVACLVLISAGLMLKSLRNLERVDLGIDPASVLTMSVDLPSRSDAQPARAAAWHSLAGAVAALPGVRDVALATDLPVPNLGQRSSITIDGGPRLLNGNPPDLPFTPGRHVVSPAYFRVLGIPLLRGRSFTDADAPGAQPVAVISDAMARMHWPGRDPIGRRVSFGAPQRRGGEPDEPWLTIVGVVADVRIGGPESPIKPEIYVPVAQTYTGGLILAVKTVGDPVDIASSVRRRINAVDLDVPITDVGSMESRVAGAVADARYRANVLGVFAIVSMLLTATGVLAIVSSRVARRRREFAIRLAIGAAGADLFRLIVRQALRLVAPAAAGGVALSMATSRWLESQLFGVAPVDPVTFAATPLALIALALLAASVPALRARGTDPMIILRSE